MKYYVKFLSLNENAGLTSCHGGIQDWEEGVTVRPEVVGDKLCTTGRIHACRLQDMIYWLSSHTAIVQVESDDIVEGDHKVGVIDATIIRVAKVDGLDLLVRYAEKCAELGAGYTPEALTAWLIAQYPAGFFEGVEA